MRMKMVMLCCFLMGAGCADPEPAAYFYGYDLSTLKIFEPQDKTEGIYPSMTVLDNPQNPFSQIQPNAETKWDLENASLTVAFYGWASILAFEATGEHQYYAASNLKAIYQKEECEAEDLEQIKEMAINAFASVLINFPTSISYLADGITSFPLAPLAEQGILELGGTLPAGYTSSGNEVAP